MARRGVPCAIVTPLASFLTHMLFDAGVAATTAYKLVKTNGDLKAVIETLEKEKVPASEFTTCCSTSKRRHPPCMLIVRCIHTPVRAADVDYDDVRSLFTHPEVANPEGIDLKWSDPDEEGLKAFLVTQKGFNAGRVDSGIAKLKKSRTTGSQMRMDSFFKVLAPPPGAATAAAGSGKADKKKKDDAAKGKAAAMGKLKNKK